MDELVELLKEIDISLRRIADALDRAHPPYNFYTVSVGDDQNGDYYPSDFEVCPLCGYMLMKNGAGVAACTNPYCPGNNNVISSGS